jgi:dTDP-4-dehydrorhamnose reductase
VTFGRVLITGAGGQLSSALEDALDGRAETTALGHADLDIADDSAREAVMDSGFDLVLNCAAFHNVDRCEQEERQAFEVNARAVKQLARRCQADGARLVHVSTNYVFDGQREEPYGEYDLPRPVNLYGISKLAGEHAALAYCEQALVVRTAGLYGLHGSASKGGNFVTRMIGRAREQGALQVVADQRLSPTSTDDLAKAVLAAVASGSKGVVHLTNEGECTWHEFTGAIMELADIDVEVEPTRTSTEPGGPQRPLNGVLARPRADELEIPRLRHWREALEDYMRAADLTGAVTAP